MIKKLLNTITGVSHEDHKAELYRNLIRHEAQIGGGLFGPIPAGHRREFFCLDDKTWVWHEEWKDTKTGQLKIRTTRYDIRPNGILKAQDGQPYRRVGVEEAENLHRAAKQYIATVKSEIYNAA